MTLQYYKSKSLCVFKIKNGRVTCFERHSHGQVFSYILEEAYFPDTIVDELKWLAESPFTVGIFRFIALELDKSTAMFRTCQEIADANNISLEVPVDGSKNP